MTVYRRVSAEDAKELAVPIALFPSKNEPEKEVSFLRRFDCGRDTNLLVSV